MLKSLHFWRVWLPPHVLALVGGLYYGVSSSTLFMFFVWYCLISGLGVAVGLHRFFSHKAFSTSKFWEQAMLYFGLLACHGNALFWVALHRGLHHRFSDEPGDPHSPHQHSMWHAYQGYAFDVDTINRVQIRAGADFLRHPEWQWSVKHYHKILWGTWLAFIAIAVVWSPVPLIGLVLAQVWAIHQEALVNLLGHLDHGGAYRNYEIDDKSVNRPILGLFTWGQALHNNHHGDAGNPDFGSVRWYEFDPSMLWIQVIRND